LDLLHQPEDLSLLLANAIVDFLEQGLINGDLHVGFVSRLLLLGDLGVVGNQVERLNQRVHKVKCHFLKVKLTISILVDSVELVSKFCLELSGDSASLGAVSEVLLKVECAVAICVSKLENHAHHLASSDLVNASPRAVMLSLTPAELLRGVIPDKVECIHALENQLNQVVRQASSDFLHASDMPTSKNEQIVLTAHIFILQEHSCFLNSLHLGDAKRLNS
jgi:hypothetical protein